MCFRAVIQEQIGVRLRAGKFKAGIAYRSGVREKQCAMSRWMAVALHVPSVLDPLEPRLQLCRSEPFGSSEQARPGAEVRAMQSLAPAGI